jgi:hypothetical protein
VPTLSNSVLLSEAAGVQCAWPLSATAQGTGLPVAALVQPVNASGVFAGPRPKQRNQARVAVQQITDKTYQEMARIAANGGGQSGSHPARDPV